jgi:formylglycine-generating enzyme required for sulfatase activity
MGSPPTEPKREVTIETPRRVVIPRRFAIAAKEVTIDQWQRFEPTHAQHGLQPSLVKQFSPDPDRPMIGFTWYIAAEYCSWLSEQAGLARDEWCYAPNQSGAYAAGMSIPADVLMRKAYRLPTEAEWEYACRARTPTKFSFGDDGKMFGEYGWSRVNSRSQTHPVGEKLPNGFGLFDMHGNVREWCWDGDDRRSYPESPEDDPRGVTAQTGRVYRGGAWESAVPEARSAARGWESPWSRGYALGFRLARW